MQVRAIQGAAAAEEASEFLKALASPHRLLIACRLAHGEETVGGLATALGARETVISQHLAVMRRQRLVKARREGQHMRYALSSDAAREIIGALSRQFCSFEAARS